VSGLTPLRLADFDEPLPPLAVEAADGTERTIALRRPPVSALETIQAASREHGDGSWPHLRAVLRAGAPDLTDAELDGLSVRQALTLATVLMKGVDDALKALQVLDAAGDDPAGGASADEPTPGSSASSGS
jgi:hypothetical protein